MSQHVPALGGSKASLCGHTGTTFEAFDVSQVSVGCGLVWVGGAYVWDPLRERTCEQMCKAMCVRVGLPGLPGPSRST